MSIVIPFRADDTGIRGRNLRAVIDWFASSGEQIILAEHAVAPVEIDVPGLVRVFVPSTGPFSKAAAVNAGVRAVETDSVAIVDADTIVNPAKLRACIRRVALRDEVIRPFGSLRDLNEREREQFLHTQALPDVTAEWDDRRGNETIPLCGGAFVVSTQRFWAAGGMDEAFVGWGGEDDAMAIALTRIGSDVRVLSGECAFHLWHPRPQVTRSDHPGYRANLKRLAWWSAATEAELGEHLRRVRERSV